MKWHLCLVMTLFLFSAAQGEEADSISNNPPLVEVHYQDDSLSPYMERRGNHAFLFGLSYESFLPKQYISTIDNAPYRSIFGESSVPIIEMQFSYKHNFSLGSVALGVGYGHGSLTDEDTGESRTIIISQQFAAMTYIMDALFEEPYLAPYAEIKLWQLGVKETSSTESFETTTQPGFTYRVGALIQLNGIDKTTAEQTTHDYGLENTYLDVFLAKYTKTQAAEDANTETDFNLGAGLRMEF